MKTKLLEQLLEALVERGIDDAEIKREGSHEFLRWACRDSVFIIGVDNKTGECYSLVDIGK
jgi:hypothetical protein